LLTKAKIDNACMAGFNDKNNKESIVESSKPEYTQVSKTLFIILVLTKAKIDIACMAGFNNNSQRIVSLFPKQKVILHAWNKASMIKKTKKTL
jgi:hypothetical protein